MHILHVIPTLDHRSGGPSTALTGLAAAQRNADSTVSVVVGRLDPGDPILADALRAAGVTVRDAAAEGGHGRVLADAIAACDVCHIHAVWEEILHRAAVIARAMGKPHLVRPCGMLDPWCLAQKRWKKKLYIAWRLRRNLDRCTTIHFTTTRERDLVRPLGFRAPSIVEPNGIDWTEFADLPDPGAFRTRHPQLEDRPIILFLGRVHRKKGLDLLVPAFARIRSRDAHLVVVGPDEGGERALIESLARREAVRERMLFTGELRGRARIEALRDADLFVLPSRQENFGVAVVESLAAGTPVVVSDQVNICDEIAASAVGGVVPLQVEAIAAGIDHWLDDSALRQEASARGRDLAQRRYDWRMIARRWRQHYEDLRPGRGSGTSVPAEKGA